MLLIRDRNELKRHIERLASMAESEAKASNKHYMSLAISRATGLRMAIEAIEAWEDYDLLLTLEGTNDET